MGLIDLRHYEENEIFIDFRLHQEAMIRAEELHNQL